MCPLPLLMCSVSPIVLIQCPMFTTVRDIFMQYLKLRAHGHKVFLPCRLYAAGRLVGLYPILSYLWRLLQHLQEVHQLDKQGVFHFYLRGGSESEHSSSK